jgi:hypothetical protein
MISRLSVGAVYLIDLLCDYVTQMLPMLLLLRCLICWVC